MVMMMDYKLSELVDSDKDIELPIITERLSSEREYRKLLRRIIKAAGRSIRDDLLPMYALSISDGAMITDGFFASAKELVARTADKIRSAAQSAIFSASILINSESAYLDSKFVSGVKAKTNTDVSAFVRPSDNSDMLKNLVERNTVLITSLTDETVEKVTQAVINAQVAGDSKTALKDTLSKILGKQAKRADLIATDQLEKLTADITAYRAKQAGLRYYIWRSKQDSRVRDYHAYLHGKLQDSKNPNHGDKGQYPRQPIRCRCSARWVVKPNN